MAQFNRNDKREDEYSETVVALNRVSKTVKGAVSCSSPLLPVPALSPAVQSVQS